MSKPRRFTKCVALLPNSLAMKCKSTWSSLGSVESQPMPGSVEMLQSGPQLRSSILKAAFGAGMMLGNSIFMGNHCPH